MRYLVPFILVLALIAAVLVVVSPRHERADFTFVNRGTINTLDPALMSWMQDIRLALAVWEGLSAYHPETTEPIPGCAYQPVVSEDRQTYTFTIRPEACWNNGDPVTAYDFVYGWRRAMEPGTARDYAFFFDHIEGVSDYVRWRLGEINRIGAIDDANERIAERDAHIREVDRRFNSNVHIRAMDDKTLKVRLHRPLAYFLDLTAFSTFLPVHHTTAERFKVIHDNGMIFYDQQWTKPGNTRYNGAFEITDWKFKRYLWLKRNEQYWDAANVKLKTVELVEVDDTNTAWLLYAGGQVDWLSTLETDYTADLIASSASPLPGATNRTGTKRHDVHAFPAFGTYYYTFNCSDKLPDGTDNPFKDPRVRQAFTMAVDKQQLVDRVVREGNQVATTFTPPNGMPGYDRPEGLPFDVAGARELLAEAGYPGGRGLREIVVLFNTGSYHDRIAEAIVGMWEANLGINGRVEGKETKTFREDKRNVNYIICRAGWYGDYGDPTTFLDMFETSNGNNDTRFSDSKYDQWLCDAAAETDPARRLSILAEAEEYLVNDALPLLPLFHYVNIFICDPHRVKNLRLTPRMMTAIKHIEVVR